LESAINYSPQTPETLREDLAQRLRAIPAARSAVRFALKSDAGLLAALKALSLLDNRPGRLYSFVCDKREDAGHAHVS
jgi:hypothetical protein